MKTLFASLIVALCTFSAHAADSNLNTEKVAAMLASPKVAKCLKQIQKLAIKNRLTVSHIELQATTENKDIYLTSVKYSFWNPINGFEAERTLVIQQNVVPDDAFFGEIQMLETTNCWVN